MKIIERKLQKEAKKVHTEILKSDEASFNEFIAEKYGDTKAMKTDIPKKKITPKMFISMAASFVLIIALSISLWIILTPKDDGSESKHYLKENELTIYHVNSYTQ